MNYFVLKRDMNIAILGSADQSTDGKYLEEKIMMSLELILLGTTDIFG